MPLIIVTVVVLYFVVTWPARAMPFLAAVALPFLAAASTEAFRPPSSQSGFAPIDALILLFFVGLPSLMILMRLLCAIEKIERDDWWPLGGSLGLLAAWWTYWLLGEAIASAGFPLIAHLLLAALAIAVVFSTKRAHKRFRQAGHSYTSFGRAFGLVFPVILSMLIVWSIWMTFSIGSKAAGIAGTNAYCIQVNNDDRFYRSAQSLIDLSPLVANGSSTQFHAILIVDLAGMLRAHNWSHRSRTFLDATGLANRVNFLCQPRADFVAALPLMKTGTGPIRFA